MVDAGSRQSPAGPGRRQESGPWQAFAVRTASDPGPLMPAIRQAVYALDPAQPVSELVTAGEALAASVQKPGFFLTLMTVMAGIGAILTAVGIYGVSRTPWAGGRGRSGSGWPWAPPRAGSGEWSWGRRSGWGSSGRPSAWGRAWLAAGSSGPFSTRWSPTTP